MDSEQVDNYVSEVEAASSDADEEKMVPQSEVNRLLGETRRKVRNRGAPQNDYYQQAQDAVSQQPSSMGGMAFDKDEVIRSAQEAMRNELEEMRQQALHEQQERYAKEVGQKYNQKIEAGRDKYEDFDDALGKFDYQRLAHVPVMALEFENTADIMYTLSKSPSKLAAFVALQKESPSSAHQWMDELSSSLKSNTKQSSGMQANEPLNRLSPSQAASDNGVLEVRDYRKKYRV